jgi:hypothetical protein
MHSGDEIYFEPNLPNIAKYTFSIHLYVVIDGLTGCWNAKCNFWIPYVTHVFVLKCLLCNVDCRLWTKMYSVFLCTGSSLADDGFRLVHKLLGTIPDVHRAVSQNASIYFSQVTEICTEPFKAHILTAKFDTRNSVFGLCSLFVSYMWSYSKPRQFLSSALTLYRRSTDCFI